MECAGIEGAIQSYLAFGLFARIGFKHYRRLFMDKSRNVVEEIMEIKSRRPSDSFYIELDSRLLYLEGAYKDRENIDRELWRYFPISIVSCSEAFFRLAIKQLIDAGEPYVTNSKDLLGNRRVDFGILKALHGQSITIGDIAGHLVSMNNLNQISEVMTKLLGHDFLNEVSQAYDRWAVEIGKESKKPIISDADLTFRFIARAFELRHIFCHEFANKYKLDISEIEQCFEHFCTFLTASREHIQQTLFPNEPLTQTDMNIDITEKYHKEKRKMESLIQKILGRLTEKQTTEFLKANKAWESFIFASAEVEGLQYEGGTIRPLIEGKALVHLVKERIKNLEKMLETINKP